MKLEVWKWAKLRTLSLSWIFHKSNNMPAAVTITNCHVNFSAKKKNGEKQEKSMRHTSQKKKVQIHRCLPYISDYCNYKIQTSLTAKQVGNANFQWIGCCTEQNQSFISKGRKRWMNITYNILCRIILSFSFLIKFTVKWIDTNIQNSKRSSRLLELTKVHQFRSVFHFIELIF